MDANTGLQASARQFEDTKKEANDLAAALTEPQFNWRPAPEKWSIGQCLAHLATTDQAIPAIDKAIGDARTRGWLASGPFRYGWFTRWMIGSMEPPPKRRMRTWPIFAPAAGVLSRDVVLKELAASRDRLVERIQAAAGLDLKRAIVVSPASRLFRIPLGGYLAFLAAHDRR
ncbi:MAG: DinB family protein, partial [Gemmatimonadales bacterium]